MKYIIIIWILCIFFIIGLFGYTVIGTKGNVETIKQMAPKVISERNWKILHYQGWQYGSWSNHGGKVWYQVCEANDSSVQYRTYVTLWDGELHFKYGSPIVLSRVNVNLKTNVQK